MKVCFFVVLVIFFTHLKAERDYMQQLYQNVNKSIVAIDVKVPEEQRKQGILKRGIYYGTGFVVGKGLVLTTRKVMQNELEARCICFDNQIIKAQVVGYDENSPLTLLKIERMDLPALKLATNYHVGDIVVTLGNTYGSIAKVSEVSISKGMVSGIYNFHRWGIILKDIVEVDCAVNPGVFGGPIVNMEQEIVAAIFSGYDADRHKGLGIPSEVIKGFLSKYNNGKVAIPDEFFFLQTFPVYLGVSIISHRNRVKIVTIEPDSPAQDGLMVFDEILQINDLEIDSREKFAKIIQTYFPGQKISIMVKRKKMIMVIPVTLVARFMR